MKKLNVVIADDHPIVLLGVRELVERCEQFEVVGEARDSYELIKHLERIAVDVVITDFNMPAVSPYGDGFKLMGYLKRSYPTVRVLVLTMIDNPLILTRLQELGVIGVIQKNQLHDEIQVALEAILSGNPFRNSGIHQADLSQTTDLDERLALLSPKEHEILRLFVLGQSVTEIARGLNRSAKTISAQKMSAMRKLNARSDQDLMAYCIERGVFN